MSPDPPRPERFDVVVVGAGFSGLYALHRLRRLGLSAVVIEAGSDVGGTWYWNRYPGARCDVQSLEYSLSFDEALQQEWRWRERYASQPEILDYARHVAERFDLRRDIRFGTRLLEARFDGAAGEWILHTSSGDRLAARFCIMATGCISTGHVPDIQGRDSFRGRMFHTGSWPHEPVDFTGETVGVIGTGSSGIQAIPMLARQARHLYVFQRTPNYSLPAHNRPMDPAVERDWKAGYAEYRRRARSTRNAILTELNDQKALAVSAEERRSQYEARWARGGFPFMASFNDLILDQEANETAAEFVRAKIRLLVRDADVAERLTPRDYPIGTKRVCIDIDYFETFNRPNVTLVDIREDPIEALTADGLRTAKAEWPLDSIVFATGFDAMTGTLLAIDIEGRGGRSLREVWAEGPRSYLGLMVAGFPNLFTITGPGSPSVLTNMLMAIEQHVEWVTDCIGWLVGQGRTTIEPTSEAQEAWTAEVAAAAARTLYPRANSWYMGRNIAGKPQGLMPYIGGFPTYCRKCDEVAANGYDGFVVS